MSDKKQSSVEWFINEIDMQFPHIDIRWKERMIEQAKAMHQQEHENAFLEGAKCYREGQAWTDQGFREFSRIVYTETFGE